MSLCIFFQSFSNNNRISDAKFCIFCNFYSVSLLFLSDHLLWWSKSLSAAACFCRCVLVHISPYERPCVRKVGHMQSERYRLWLKCLSLNHPLKISVLIESPSGPRPSSLLHHLTRRTAQCCRSGLWDSCVHYPSEGSYRS